MNSEGAVRTQSEPLSQMEAGWLSEPSKEKGAGRPEAGLLWRNHILRQKTARRVCAGFARAENTGVPRIC
jgi:hypothetical protein